MDRSAFHDVLTQPLPGREVKPRVRGITMVIDKGLGLGETRELLLKASSYIDMIKFAFGTSVLYSQQVLRGKIELIKSFGLDVYPGGTLLEIALFQNRVAEFLDRCVDLGFTLIEVSEGTLDVMPRTRQSLIAAALKRGFRVLTEVGKKDPGFRLTTAKIREQIQRDLDAGAFRVIIEGRDSGRGVGIYDERGEIRQEELEKVLSAVDDADYLIWEAPQPKQQRHLIALFGGNVNLGNIQPNDVITLESMRTGLRSDTFRLVVERAGAAAGS